MALETRFAVILRFGTFEVDLRAGELRKQGVRVKLQEQPFRVLSVLLQRPGEVVSREELRSQIWPADTFVDFDNGLNTSINKLREALGDSSDNPRFIETLPRRGYRFIASVTSKNSNGTAVDAVLMGAKPDPSWKTAALVALIVLTTVVALGRFWRSRNAQRLTEKDTIVLADFTNTTGDSVFDETLKQGLRVQLEQSPFLNILSDEKASEQLRLMERPKDERLTPDLGRGVCQRVGSKAVLVGSISSLGTHYVIGLNALNCQTGESLGSEQVEADSREHVLGALGESATRMRERLGESLASVQRYDAPLEQVTTSSLEALQAYSLGLKTWYTKGANAAIPFFRRAVELDPQFAMAYARMGARYDEMGKTALAVENTEKAYALRDKVTARERLYIEVHYYESVTGEMERAVQVFEVWQQIHPHDETPYNNLAYLYANISGNYERALEEAREAVRLGPDQDNYVVLCALYLRLNRLHEAEAVLKQAEELKLQSELLLWDAYILAFLEANTSEMERLAGKAGARDILHDEQAYVEAYHGRLKKSRELFRYPRVAAEHNGLGTMAGSRAHAAGVEAFLGDATEARADARTALRLVPDRDVQVRATLALALAGDMKDAEEKAVALDKRWPLYTDVQHYWLPTIRAAMALNRKEANKALELLREMAPYEMAAIGWLEPTYLRGRAYLMLPDGTAAAREFQKIIDHPGMVLENPVGALAHLGLARAYALQGDTAKSRAAYQDFLTLWKDADPDIPILKQAKAEYAKLQ
jgi:DNA-binding winged helix-turn-helix (wHTH) protein/tetratricopeptide (TPR) repeat protein